MKKGPGARLSSHAPLPSTWIEPLCGLNFPLDVADGDAAALLGVEVAGHLQEKIHSPCRFDSPLWQAPSWTEVANGYLDLTQWGPPPWTELQWVTLRNVIELAQDS